MKKSYMLISFLFLLKQGALAQIITHSNGEIEIPNVNTSAGPTGLGSLLWFSSGSANTAIQENWGLNLSGEVTRPVKIINSSLLVGYGSVGANFGSGNAFVSGLVGINTTNTHGYQFAVNGTAIATSMTVQAYLSWPDYVFRPTYTLPSLTEVKTYIDNNHHLPEIPTEQQIEKDGLNLGEMNKLLVKKVEELTLYLIELNKQVKQQQKEIEQLKKTKS